MSLSSKLKNIHFLSLMGTGGISVLNFLFTALLYRSFSVKEIGIWFFFQTFITFLDTFRQGFLTTAFIKFYSGESQNRKNEVIGSTWIIASLITIVFIALNLPIIFVYKYISDESLLYFLKFFSINLISTLPIIVSTGIAQGELKFQRLMYIRILQVVILIMSLITLNYLEKTDLSSLMMANISSAVITSLFCIVMGWSGIMKFFLYSKSCIMDLYNFGKYTVATSISTNLFGITDTFIINFMLGPSSLAVFNLGKKLMEVVDIPIRSFVATALPSLSKAYNENNKLLVIETMKKYIGIITISLIPIVFVTYLLAEPAMSIIGGGQYKNTKAGETAVNIFKLITMFAFLFPADRFMSVTLDAIHKPHVNFFKVIIMLIVNLISDFLGVYILGNIYGIVIATIFPVLTAIIISNYVIQKEYQKFSFLDIYRSSFIEIKKYFMTLIDNKIKKRKV
ncbi:MAG: oligosaccharide flippase family protein [Bacteroidota bacterium]